MPLMQVFANASDEEKMCSTRYLVKELKDNGLFSLILIGFAMFITALTGYTCRTTAISRTLKGGILQINS